MPVAPPPLRRLVFLHRYYWPEEPATAQLLTDLAEALAAHGHAVTIIMSRRARSPGSWNSAAWAGRSSVMNRRPSPRRSGNGAPKRASLPGWPQRPRPLAKSTRDPAVREREQLLATAG